MGKTPKLIQNPGIIQFEFKFCDHWKLKIIGWICTMLSIHPASQQLKNGRNKLFCTLSCWCSSNTFCEHQSDGQRFGTKFRLPSTLLLDSNHPSFVFFLKMIVMDMDHWTIFSLTPLNFCLGYFFFIFVTKPNLIISTFRENPHWYEQF